MKGEVGVKDPQNSVNVVFGCPLEWSQKSQNIHVRLLMITDFLAFLKILFKGGRFLAV